MLTVSFYNYGLFLIGILIIGMPGCKKPVYNQKNLSQIPVSCEYTHMHNGITLQIKKLSKPEAQALFDGRGNRLLSKRKLKSIYPFYLSVENKSNSTLILDPKNISIPVASYQVIATRLYSHTSRRIVTPLLIGIVGTTASFFAAAYITILGAIAAMPAVIKAGYATLGISGFFAVGSPVLSYYQGHYALAVNEGIDRDLKNKMLYECVEINLGQSLNKLIFIPCKSYNSFLSIDLVEKTTGQRLSFDIELAEGEQPCKK
jgi:hypothetical protein